MGVQEKQEIVVIETLLESEFKSFRGNVENILSECPFWNVIAVHARFKSVSITLGLIGNTTNGADQIDICYAQKCDCFQEEEFSTNLAAKGAFELLGSRASHYYIAVGDLLSNKDVLTQLRIEMERFTNKVYELRNEYDKIKNPKI